MQQFMEALESANTAVPRKKSIPGNVAHSLPVDHTVRDAVRRAVAPRRATSGERIPSKSIPADTLDIHEVEEVEEVDEIEDVATICDSCFAICEQYAA